MSDVWVDRQPGFHFIVSFNSLFNVSKIKVPVQR